MNYIKSYNKLSFIVKVILAIIPITSVVNAIIYRLAGGHIFGAIIAFLLCPLFWILDLVTVILSGKPTVFA